ncbi:2869_t:CDS:2, partial [Gigaspora margarita]
NYIYKHLGSSQKFVINNKSEFPLLWEAFNRKMKVLKQSEKAPISGVYMVLSLLAPHSSKYSQMKVTQFTFLSDRELQFTKFSQKNDLSGIEENLDSLIIPVPSDPERYLEPVHNIKLYLSKRPINSTCQFLHLKINKNIHEYEDVKINIKDRNIINYSGKTMPITYLFHESIPIVTSMSITSHKSESLYNNSVEDFVNKNQDLEPDNNNSSGSRVLPKSSVYSEFRTPLKDSTKLNLPFHIHATKKIQLLVEK